MSSEEERLRQRVASVFEEEAPPAGALLQRAYARNEDAGELRDAIAGKSWSRVAVLDLFRNREMLVGLSGVGYRAYVPAYLCAALSDDTRYAGDFRFYLLQSLGSLSASAQHIAAARERLSCLTEPQRAVIGEVLDYLARGGSQEASEMRVRWR